MGFCKTSNVCDCVEDREEYDRVPSAPMQDIQAVEGISSQWGKWRVFQSKENCEADVAQCQPAEASR